MVTVGLCKKGKEWTALWFLSQTFKDNPSILMQCLRPSTFGLLPSAYGLRPMAYGLRPVACGLRPAACGLRPVAFGLRPAACGLRPTAYGLRPSASLIKMCWANRAIHIWFPILLGTNWLKGESRLRKICKQGTVWGQIQRARAQRGCMVIIYPPCSLFPHKTPLPTIAIHNPINICFLAHDTDTKGV